MNSLSEIIDMAKSTQNIASDRKLAKLLDVDQKSVSGWRCGKTWPNDENIIKLAYLANIPAHEAVLLVSLMKAPDNVKPIYEDILKKVTASIAVSACLCVLFSANPAVASTPSPVNETPKRMYIMENNRRIRKGGLFNIIKALKDLCKPLQKYANRFLSLHNYHMSINTCEILKC